MDTECGTCVAEDDVAVTRSSRLGGLAWTEESFRGFGDWEGGEYG